MNRFHTECLAQLAYEKVTVTGELQNLKSQAQARCTDPVLIGQINLYITRLDKIKRAENRIQSGSYGTCRYCGQVIPHERLAVEPCAEECVSCPLKQFR